MELHSSSASPRGLFRAELATGLLLARLAGGDGVEGNRFQGVFAEFGMAQWGFAGQCRFQEAVHAHTSGSPACQARVPRGL